MSFDVETLAGHKSSETGHARPEWHKALDSARQSLKPTEIGYDSLERIALAAKSPEKFTALTRLIYQYVKSRANAGDVTQLILQYTNESPFSLTEWVDAIDLFYTWLLEHDRKVNFPSMLNYLECCVASPDAQEGGQTLAGLLEDMLRVHGYDGK